MLQEFSSLERLDVRFRVPGLEKVAGKDVILTKLSHPIRFVAPIFMRESGLLESDEKINNIECCDINAVSTDGIFYTIPPRAKIEISDQ
jgi:hypothetical protein